MAYSFKHLNGNTLIGSGTYKFKHISGEKEKAIPINLKGATVTVPIDWIATENYGSFKLTGTLIYKGQTYSLTEAETQTFRIGQQKSSSTGKFLITYYLKSLNTYSSYFMYPDESGFTFNITGGEDVDNPFLIKWFLDNNATIEGGVWGEKLAMKYLYNGVKLPKISQELVSKYPYAWIRNHTTNNQYQLILASYPWYYNNGVRCSGGDSVTVKWYNINKTTADSATSWEYSHDTTGGFTVDSSRPVLWSNHDIPNGSATATEIYFEGSEPVPTDYYEKEVEKYFYVKNDTGNDFTFLYDSTKTTFNDYIGVYAIDSTWSISKNSYDNSMRIGGIGAQKDLYIDSSLSTPVLYTTPVIQGSTYYSKDGTNAGGGSN